MFIRNGIRSNLRARGRTALFAGLIFFLTLAMILALGVRIYCGSAVAACDEAYRSIALVEYMGAEYPDGDEPDDFARAAADAIDDTAVAAVDGVRSWDRSDRSMAWVEGYRRGGGSMPYKNRGVLTVWNLKPVYEMSMELRPGAEEEPGFAPSDINFYEIKETGRLLCYSGILSRAIYSFEGKEEVAVQVLPGNLDFAPEPGKSYYVHGTFQDAAVGLPNDGRRIFRLLPFERSDAQPWAERVAGEPVPEVFQEAADHYRIGNSYVEVVTAPDLENLWPFHQGILYLKEGRMPEPGETEACVISGDVSERAGLTLGDTVTARAFSADSDNRYDLTLTGQEETLRVVGITNPHEEYMGCLWRLGSGGDAPLFGYLIGTAALENARGAEAVEAMQTMMPENVHVTLLDQGYADAVEPFRTMQSTATNVLLICGIGVVAVLVLFAFLFVGRQKETVRILVSLGTPRDKIALWLLSGAVLIAGASALLGGAIGAAALPLLFRQIQQSAARMRSTRLRFSEMLLGSVKEPDLSVTVPPWPILLVILGVLLISVLLCLLFLRTAYRGGTLRRGKSRVRVPKGKTSLFGRGSPRFALLSIRRGGLRSLVVPLVSAVLTVLIIVLCGVYHGWQQELDAAVEQTTLEGQVTNTSGRFYSGLLIQTSTVQTLWELDDVGEILISQRWHYWLEGDKPKFAETILGEEMKNDWVRQQPEIVAVNGLKGAKEFYFTDPVVQWLDGWDEGFLAAKGPTFGEAITVLEPWESESGNLEITTESLPAVVSDRFLEERDLALGDTFQCQMENIPVSLQIVGAYKQTGNRSHIYVPLSCYVDPEIPFGPVRYFSSEEWEKMDQEEQQRYFARSFTFSTCRFTLTSARNLDATRQRLAEAGFGWPGHLGFRRITVLLRDASFTKLTENLGRYLTMGRAMMGMIFVIVALLGFIISWLMINGRKREFVIMRGFGVERRQVFLSFFLEQAALCGAGCLAGCVSLFWLVSGGAVQWAVLAAYLVCYLSGCAISVILIGRTNLMELLSVRE